MCMSEEQMHPNILSAIIIVASAIHGHFSSCMQNMHWPGGSLKKKQQTICKESPRTAEGSGMEWVTPELLSFSSFARFTNIWQIEE